jgi:hypothetical protein
MMIQLMILNLFGSFITTFFFLARAFNNNLTKGIDKQSQARFPGVKHKTCSRELQNVSLQ